MNTEQLDQAINWAKNGLNSSIANRREHPTYGYTKASILADLHQLEGLLQARNIVVTGRASATAAFDSFAAAEALGIDLADLQARARKA